MQPLFFGYLKTRMVIFSMLGIFGFLSFPILASAGEKVARIRVVGSSTVLPLASRAAERFAVMNKDSVKITVNAGGSGVGVHSVANSRADIGMLSRELTEKEISQYKDADLRVFVVGLDGVACVVSSEIYSHGVRNLSREQIRDIYLGKIRNWKKVGGPDREIVVVDKERHRGTRHVFMKYVFGNETARAPGARLVTGSNNEEQSKISQSDSAIGMLSHAWLNEDVVGLGIRQEDEVIEPTLENIRSSRYPITRNLIFVTAGEPRGRAKEFIDFVMSPQGQEIVVVSGYLSPADPRPDGSLSRTYAENRGNKSSTVQK